MSGGRSADICSGMLNVVPPGSRLREDRLEFLELGLFRRATNLPVERFGPL